MGMLDKFLRMASTRYPEAKKLNRVMKTVGRDIERRHPQIAEGLPGAEKMFNQRSELYGRLLDKKNQMADTIGSDAMNPALLKFLQKYATGKNLGIGAAGLGTAGLGAYAGHRATMNALPESLLEAIGLPGDMADDITNSIEDAYKYVEEHPVAAASIAAPAAYGLSRAGGDIGQKIQSMGEGMMAERRRRRK